MVSLDKEAFSVPYHESKATRGQRVCEFTSHFIQTLNGVQKLNFSYEFHRTFCPKRSHYQYHKFTV